ncbi:type I restriction enzyme, S subunit [Bathymodiolus platifrons methanotrophic gill symbiont]|uniref:restriction endonuclease subunit S n=1 Tax=Bathymodiolus platifrons methanotrophic gill symbiont TaxID=113268 RepID=UPI001B78D811|nr:restriction endonuclease subunit S [Bathymodiolus platifrons methanotrophic gill symbiont]GFO74345.1 type I restriction enzyme, S subunit [Bathymodiolus platifrons methanotrophic gill symbiont]
MIEIKTAMDTGKHPLEFMGKLLCECDVKWKALEDIAEIYGGLRGKSKNDFENGNARYVPYKNIFFNIDVDFDSLELVSVSASEKQNSVQYGDVLFTGSSENAEEAGMSSAVTIEQKDDVYLNSFSFGIRFNDDIRFIPDFSKYLFRSRFMRTKIARTANGVTRFNISKARFKKIKIPIPCPDTPERSLAIQAEIVRILDTFTTHTAELTARKKQYNYYRDQLLTFEDGQVEWKTKVEIEWETLESVFHILAGGDVPKATLSDTETEEFNIPILSNGIGNNSLYGWTDKAKVYSPSLTISARGTIGWTSFRENPFFPIVRLLVLTPKVELNLKYAYYFMKTIENSYHVPKNGIPQLTKPMVKDIKFPIPPLNIQTEIVTILDKFDALTNSISEGLPREIKLRQQQYEYYRDLLLSFPKSETTV